MNKNLKIATITLASLALAGTLFASSGSCDNNKKDSKNCFSNSCGMAKHFKGHKRGGFDVLGMFKELNLSDEQKTKIEKIVEESRKNQKSQFDAFSKTAFDKELYIKAMNEKRDDMVKSRAQVIEKSYAVLTSEQKEQLKVLMDLRKERMENYKAFSKAL